MNTGRDDQRESTLTWRFTQCFGLDLPSIIPDEVYRARNGIRSARELLIAKLDVGIGRLVEGWSKTYPYLNLASTVIIENTMRPIRHQIEKGFGQPAEHDDDPGGIWRCLEDPIRGNIRTWAYLRAAASNSVQRAISKDRSLKKMSPGTMLENKPSYASSEQQVEQSHRWCANLSATEREVVVLRYWHGIKLVDIARIKNKSCATIRSQLHRSLTKIRAYILQSQD